MFIAKKALKVYDNEVLTYNNYILMTVIILTICAFFTSIISALIGMGGGILLLSVMTFFFPMSTIIPIHGLVQLTSNTSRLFIMRDHIKAKFALYFLCGLPFGSLLAVYILKNFVTNHHALIFVLALIIYSLFKPKKLPHIEIKNLAWILVGFIAGILAIIVGTMGPFIAVFFVRDDLSKEEIIATKASLQMLGHLIKIPAFFYLSFSYSHYFNLIICMGIAALIGTKVGSIFLYKVKNNLFKKLYKFVLGLSGIRILFKIFGI